MKSRMDTKEAESDPSLLKRKESFEVTTVALENGYVHCLFHNQLRQR